MLVPPAVPEPPPAIAIAAPQAYAGTAIDRLNRERPDEILLHGRCLRRLPAVRQSRYSVEASALASPAPPPPPAPIPVKSARAPRVELFDREAKVRIEVTDIDAGRAQLVALTRAFDGQVMNEAVEDGNGRRGAALSLRIPSEGVTRFIARLGELGKLSSTSLETHTSEPPRKLDDAGVVEARSRASARALPSSCWPKPPTWPKPPSSRGSSCAFGRSSTG